MDYVALALDYDGTLATDGIVPAAVTSALRRFRATNRRLVLVTGRELPDLRATFDGLVLFERVVAENGALLHVPETGEERPLAPAPPPALLDELRARGVPFSAGRVIVATWEAHHATVQEVLEAGRYDLEIIVNKGAVMLLPAGINKGTGLSHAASELGLDLAAIIGMGDGENDHSLLATCGLGVAVANATEPLKAAADLVTAGARGAGVIEVIDALETDPSHLVRKLRASAPA